MHWELSVQAEFSVSPLYPQILIRTLRKWQYFPYYTERVLKPREVKHLVQIQGVESLSQGAVVSQRQAQNSESLELTATFS